MVHRPGIGQAIATAAMLSLCAVAACKRHASATPGVPASVSTATATLPNAYADAANGVSFRYPSTWTTSQDAQGFLPSAILDNQGVQAQQVVSFLAKGTPYADTDLGALRFTYAVATVPNASSCHDLVAKNGDASGSATTVVVNGASFTEVKGGDAGMSHHLSLTLDGTFRNGICMLFERDKATIAPGVQQATRPLTATEEQTLQRQLAEIFQSVQIEAE